MTGELEIERPGGLLIHPGLMFEKDNETAGRCASEGLAVGEVSPKHRAVHCGIVHPDQIDRPGHGRHISPQHGESGLLRKIEGLVDSRVELMVSGHGKLSVPGKDRPKLRRGFGHAVELTIHKIARGNDQIRFRLPNLSKDSCQSFPLHQDADMEVGDLDDPEPPHVLRDLRRTDLQVFRPNVPCLERSVGHHSQRDRGGKEENGSGSGDPRADVRPEQQPRKMEQKPV